MIGSCQSCHVPIGIDEEGCIFNFSRPTKQERSSIKQHYSTPSDLFGPSHSCPLMFKQTCSSTWFASIALVCKCLQWRSPKHSPMLSGIVFLYGLITPVREFLVMFLKLLGALKACKPPMGDVQLPHLTD